MNARGNVMLEVVRDHFQVRPDRMHLEIQGMLQRLVRILKAKGIDYQQLKPALVPQQDRREIALVFDTSSMTGWYSLPIHERLLPLLHRKSSRSILHGDLLSRYDQDFTYEVLTESLVLARDLTYRHSSQFYVVYLNNLTDKMVEDIREGMRELQSYAGYVDTTYASRFKMMLALTLSTAYIQHRGVIIGPHEDDRPDSDDVNLPGFPFGDHGFKLRSVPGDLEGVLLTYKIEAPVFSGFETDTEFSLNSVHPMPVPLADLEIVIEDPKLAYLQREKAESLRRIGLLDGDAAALRSLIRSKIASNYIYSMAHNDEHYTTQFNIILEIKPPHDRPFRVLVGLEYLPLMQQLRLITMF